MATSSEGPKLHEVELTVNGRTSTVRVPARRLLSDTLRIDLGLTGTHVGCEHGVCGCCTVMIDGLAMRSCLMLAVTADCRDIRTVEGLADDDGTLHPVQEAFRECHGLQCGFCTPGFLMTSVALLERNPEPDDEEITEAIAGNLCRCTGYQNIKAAVRKAAELAGEGDR
jgi:carbon-monoxide dehydrogenase small subunit